MELHNAESICIACGCIYKDNSKRSLDSWCPKCNSNNTMKTSSLSFLFSYEAIMREFKENNIHIHYEKGNPP